MIISLSTTFDTDERYTIDPEISRINRAQLVKSIMRHTVSQIIGSGFTSPGYPSEYRGFWIEFLQPIGYQTGIFIRDEGVNLVTYDNDEERVHFYDNQDTSWTIAAVVTCTERVDPDDPRYKK